MKKLLKEFTEFINKGNAVALAIGVIIGGAFSSIVSAINVKIISPLIGWILGDYDLNDSLITVLTQHTEIVDGEEVVVIDNAIYWGSFLQSVIDFLLIAVVLFVIFKVVSFAMAAAKRSAERMQAMLQPQEEEAPAEEVAAETVVEEPQPSAEVLLLTEIRDLLSKRNSEE